MIQLIVAPPSIQKYNYTVFTTFTSTSIGNVSSSVSASTTVTANSFTATPPSSALTLPIGIYIVNAYCAFTPSSSVVHTLRLGISTSSTSFVGSCNTTIKNTVSASALQHSISYTYILSNPSSTGYFFVFNTNVAGNISLGSFNGRFIRIG